MLGVDGTSALMPSLPLDTLLQGDLKSFADSQEYIQLQITENQ